MYKLCIIKNKGGVGMEFQDVGICVEYSFENAKNKETHTIFRPGNIKTLKHYLGTPFIECLREEYGATKCWVSNIYVKAKKEDGKLFEFRLGNRSDFDMDAELFL